MAIRAHVSDLTLRLNLPSHGAIETHGRLLPLQTGTSAGRGDGDYKLCTEDRVPVKRKYVHGETEQILSDDELHRYIQGNKKNDEPEVLKMLTTAEYEAVKEAKKSQLPKDIVEITIHSAESENELWPTSDRKSYVLAPPTDDPVHIEAYDILAEIVGNSCFTVLSQANIRNSEGFYALRIWRGYIVLQPMIYTDALNPHEPIKRNLDDAIAKNAFDVGRALMQGFDPSVYADNRVEAVRAIEAGTDLAEIIKDQAKAKSVANSMLAFLDAQG